MIGQDTTIDNSVLGYNSRLQGEDSLANRNTFTTASEFQSNTEGGAVGNYNMGSINAGKINAGTITSTVAYAGTLSFNQLSGGTATLGGTASGDGVLSVKNVGGSEVVKVDNTGITVNNGSITIKDTSGSSVIDSSGLVGNTTFNSDMKFLTGSNLDVSGDHQWAEIGFDYTFTLTRPTPYYFFGYVGYTTSGNQDDITARIKVGTATYYPDSYGWEQSQYKQGTITTTLGFNFSHIITIPAGTAITLDLEAAGLSGDETVTVNKGNTPKTYLGYLQLGK